MSTTDPTPSNAAANDPAATAPAQEAAAPSPESKLQELEARHAEVSDAYLRAKAEAENTRRRADDEIAKARKYAVEAFADSLLPVKDSLEAALAVSNVTAENLRSGVELTLKQLNSVFEKFRVTEINPAGQKFDPHRHQAINTVEADAEPNSVVQVFQKGYLLNDRVIRPAMVAVAKPKSG